MQTIRSTTLVLAQKNIDTDQIIPAQYLSLVPTIPEEYQRLGQYALSGLPTADYPVRLVDSSDSPYAVVVAGRNFGCGSSREHAPIALGAAGVQAVVAESFARIFYRNAIATGELYPIECTERLIDALKTGDTVTVDLETCRISRDGEASSFEFKPLGVAGDVISAGGMFAYARETGLVVEGNSPGKGKQLS